jgi:hypothetical protein
MEKDSVKKRIFYANLDIGLGANLYHFKYYNHNPTSFNVTQKERFFDANAIISFGASFKIKNVKMGAENLNFKLSNFSVGYDVFSFFPKKFSSKKMYLSIVGSTLQGYDIFRTDLGRKERIFFYNSSNDAFYRSHWNTSLFGFNMSFQYKKFEFYYTLLKYRRFVALDAKEHQHLICIKYNIFKEKL